MFDHVVLLRHGETQESASGVFTGRRDVPLDDRGRRQAQAWSDVLPELVEQCWSSPLSRASETARLAGLVPKLRGSLIEWDMGSLEGMNAEAFRESHPRWSLFSDGAPDSSGESPVDVWSRAAVVSEWLRSDVSGTVILVSHGQFLRVLAARILDLPQSVAAGFAFGPARAGVISRRSSGRLALTGWNVPAQAGAHLLSDLT